ncbi:MAG: FG-GAP-like repeat-containing protein [Phycisphaerales bacterium]
MTTKSFSVVASSLVVAGSMAAAHVARAQVFESVDLLERMRGTNLLNDQYAGAPLATGDVNGDGYDDLLVRPSSVNQFIQGSARLWFGGPSGLTGPIPAGFSSDFGPVQSPVPLSGRPDRAALGNVNGDPFDDLITISGSAASSFLDVWIGNGQGGFTFVQSFFGAGSSFIVTDLDRDQDIDVAVGGPNQLTIFLNQKGVLNPSKSFAVPAHNSRPIRANFNLDDNADILFADSIFFSDGDGTFERLQRPELLTMNVLAAIDLNQDGLDDLLTNDAPQPAVGPLWPWWVRATPRLLGGALLTETGFVSTGLIRTPFGGPYIATTLPKNNANGYDIAIAPIGNMPFAELVPSPSQAAFGRVRDGTIVFDHTVGLAGAGVHDIVTGDFNGDHCPELASYTTGGSFFLTDSGFFFDTSAAIARVPTTCDTVPAVAAPVSHGGAYLTTLSESITNLQAADLDADGVNDLIVTRSASSFSGNGLNLGTNRQLFFRSLGGRFDFNKPIYFIGSDTAFRNVEVHDTDGDGRPELFGLSGGLVRPVIRPISDAGGAALPDFFEQAFALSAAATPAFRAPTPSSGFSQLGGVGTNRGPTGLRMAFNADATPEREMVWFQNFGNTGNTAQPSRIVVQSPAGTEVRTTTTTRLAAVAPIDFDADGDIDLIGVERPNVTEPSDCACFTWLTINTSCSCIPPGTLKVFLNNGAGSFTPIDTTIPTPSYSDETWPTFFVRDFTGDGVPDAALVTFAAAELRLFVGTPAGLDPQPIISNLGFGIRQPTIADIDRDGDLDLVGVNDFIQGDFFFAITPDRPRLYLNDGIGRFPPSPRLGPAAAAEPALPLLADFDNDSDPDLAFAHSSGQVTISMNLTPPACSADFNADRTVDTRDLVFFLGRFGQTATPGSPAAQADFNNDGIVNTPDLVFFLGRFSETCPL